MKLITRKRKRKRESEKEREKKMKLPITAREIPINKGKRIVT